MRMPASNRWTVGEYTFTEHTEHGFPDFEGKPLYKFEINGKRSMEMYPSLDEALVAAVGEKYTGPRGAGGSGVGTAADWFLRMIGAERRCPESDCGEPMDLIERGAVGHCGAKCGN